MSFIYGSDPAIVSDSHHIVPVGQLNNRVVAAAASSTEQQTDAFARVTAEPDRQAWKVPSALSRRSAPWTRKVQNVLTTVVRSLQPVSPVTSEDWYGS